MTATDTAHRTEAAVGIPWRSPALVAILAATLVTPMDVPLVSPLLPEIQAVFGVSESHAGLLITLYAVPGIVLAPVIGALADRIGRRYVLSGCLVVFGLAGTAIAFTTEFRVALGLRLLQGFREYDLPTFDADDQDAGDASQLRAHLRQADAILLGSPMYHGSFSSPLKTALDYSGFDEFEETTVGLVVVSGGSFPRPTLEQLRSVTRARAVSATAIVQEVTAGALPGVAGTPLERPSLAV
jgi:hypothetical protein